MWSTTVHVVDKDVEITGGIDPSENRNRHAKIKCLIILPFSVIISGRVFFNLLCGWPDASTD